MKSSTSLKRIAELKIGVAALALLGVGVLNCAAPAAQRAGTARMKGDRSVARQPITDVQEFSSCLKSCTSDNSACLMACLALSGETDPSVIHASGHMPPIPFMQDSTTTCLNMATSNVKSCADNLLIDDIGGKQSFWLCAGAAARRFLACSKVERIAGDDEEAASRFGLGLVLRLAELASAPDGFYDGIRDARAALAPATTDADAPSGTIAATTPLLNDDCFDTCASNLRSNKQTCEALFPTDNDGLKTCKKGADKRFADCVDACSTPAE